MRKLKPKARSPRNKDSLQLKWLNIIPKCNPYNNIIKEDIEHYSDQMEEPKLITDLNAHRPLWEFKTKLKLTNKTEKSVFYFPDSISEILLSPPGQTTIDP